MAKKHQDWKNLEDYSKGKTKLKNAILQHPKEGIDGNSIYDFMKSKVKRNMWVIPFEQFKNRDK